MLGFLNAINPVALVGQAISSLSSLAGPVLGYASNREANETNVELANEANALQESMFNRQLDYNTQMWNLTNEYNSPQSQVTRLLRAGLNPSLMMQGQGGSLAGSVNAPAAPAAQRAEVHPYDWSPLSQGLRDSVSLGIQHMVGTAQARNINAQAQNAEIEARFKAEETAERIANLLQNTKLTRTQRKLLTENLHYTVATMNDMISQQGQLTKQAKLRTDLLTEEVWQAEINRAISVGNYQMAVRRLDLDAASVAAALQESAQRVVALKTQNKYLGTKEILSTAQQAIQYELMSAGMPYRLAVEKSRAFMAQWDANPFVRTVREMEGVASTVSDFMPWRFGSRGAPPSPSDFWTVPSLDYYSNSTR